MWLRWIRWCCFIFYANIALNKARRSGRHTASLLAVAGTVDCEDACCCPRNAQVEFEHRKLHCRPEELLMGCSQTGEEAFRRVAPDVPQRLSVFACSMTLIGRVRAAAACSAFSSRPDSARVRGNAQILVGQHYRHIHHPTQQQASLR